jgi:carbonic anhydrase
MRVLVIVICLFAAWAPVAQAQESKAASHWAYSGPEGPKDWGKITPEYQTCRFGHAQSPIDIRDTKKEPLPPIQFDYKPATLKVINNGHSIQVDYPPGSFITVGEKKYELKQFHFHHPSEEHIHGKRYDMVVHLVHADSDGKLAVVAVLVTKGSSNAMIAKIWQNLPKTQGQESEVAGVEVNPAGLLPQETGYYTFVGSLTTPPCSESVTWFVLKKPMEFSPAEIATFARMYPHDARPIQALNGRTVAETE